MIRIRTVATFEGGKIGRATGVPPLEIAEADADAVARAIHRYADKRLLSRGVDVDLDLDPETGEGDGVIAVGGFRIVAHFTLTPPASTEQSD